MSNTTTAAETLDNIRAGAQRMVVNTHLYLGECREHIDTGNFVAAFEAAQRLTGRLQSLAHAQGALGALAHGRLVRCSDLEVGMRTQEGGPIVEIERCDCGDPECEKALVRFEGGGQAVMHGEWEIAIVDE